jgi:hypothetical protein
VIADKWKRIRDAFVAIAHHRSAADEEEIRLWMDRLDGFLVGRLRPRTFETFSLLDQLIEEGESSAGG